MSIIERAADKLEKEAGENASRIPLSSNNDVEPAKLDAYSDELQEKAPSSSPVHVKNGKSITLDLEGLHQQGIVSPAHGKSQIAEQYRIIKRPLLKKAFGKEDQYLRNGNLIMLTSALPGEGKSFSAVNLAMSIATEMDHRVLLVDADVARPSIPKVLGFGAKKGLLDVLLNPELGVADVMLKTNVEKLTIVTAGRPHTHATELLASKDMDLLLQELAQRYQDRIVIFDSPPTLITSEARVLATQMGQIILVVEAEKTTQHVVKETLRQLESCQSIDLIYNKSREFSGGGEYFGYYYS